MQGHPKFVQRPLASIVRTITGGAHTTLGRGVDPDPWKRQNSLLSGIHSVGRTGLGSQYPPIKLGVVVSRGPRGLGHPGRDLSRRTKSQLCEVLLTFGGIGEKKGNGTASEHQTDNTEPTTEQSPQTILIFPAVQPKEI